MPVTAPTPDLTLDDAIAAARAGDGPAPLVHDWCECQPDRSLCGLDLTGAEDAGVFRSDDACVVCAELAWHPCQRCGS